MASNNWVFVLIEFTNILINLDHGILPACTQQISAYYDIGPTELGVLGSIVYLGIIVTGVYVGRLYQKFNSKLVCLIGLGCMCVSLLMFVLSKLIWLAMFSRFLTGAFQVFMLVYFPVWIDKFGGDKATTWITLLQIGVPLGIFAGYGMTSIIVQTAVWQWSFYIQIGLILVCIIGFIMLKQQRLDVKEAASHATDLEQHLMIREGTVKKKPTYFQLLCILLKTRMYIIAIMTMSVMLFVSTGIQFWMTNYFIEVLHFQRTSVNIAYAVVSITGPTLGCAFGGYVVNSIGGYYEPRTIYFIWVFSAVGIGAGVVIPFVSTFYVSAILLWLVLFFGGAMVPGLTGMIMSSVQPEMRSFGNSKGEIIKNTFGYFPSPFLYGLVNSLSPDPRAGITLIMFWGLWAPVLLAIGSYWTFRQGRKALEVSKEVTLDESDTNSPTKQVNGAINDVEDVPPITATQSAEEFRSPDQEQEQPQPAEV